MKRNEQLLAKVQKMIYKQAWAAAKQYKIPYEEALSNCYWEFVRASNGFYRKNSSMKFSTFLQQLMKWHFLTIKRNTIRDASRFKMVQLTERVAGLAPEQRSPCLEAVDDLSKDAKEIVGLLVDTPAELMELWQPRTPNELLRKIKKHLRDKKGRDRQKLEEAHLEIQTTFRQIWAGI